jgi:hypothetical protein
LTGDAAAINNAGHADGFARTSNRRRPRVIADQRQYDGPWHRPNAGSTARPPKSHSCRWTTLLRPISQEAYRISQKIPPPRPGGRGEISDHSNEAARALARGDGLRLRWLSRRGSIERESPADECLGLGRPRGSAGGEQRRPTPRATTRSASGFSRGCRSALRTWRTPAGCPRGAGTEGTLTRRRPGEMTRSRRKGAADGPGS